MKTIQGAFERRLNDSVEQLTEYDYQQEALNKKLNMLDESLNDIGIEVDVSEALQVICSF